MSKLLWGATRKALEMCGVSLPARVTAYDRTTRRASVQPQVVQRMTDGQTIERKPLSERPVLLPRGDGFGLWFDLAANDPCVTLISDEQTSSFYLDGQAGAPVFGSRHQQSDAVILPGGVPDPEQAAVNGVGECVIGTADLTACVIFRRATPEDAAAAGTVEVRVSVRLDLGGAGGQPVARAGDPVTLDEATIAAINVIAGAAGAAPLTPETSTATIAPRPGAVVYSK
ncbi:MAG: hypothetical protein JNK56_14195 [Myxococcales bacterium]|nr:hypothetical protein [Myxococcales bacterium]